MGKEVDLVFERVRCKGRNIVGVSLSKENIILDISSVLKCFHLLISKGLKPFIDQLSPYQELPNLPLNLHNFVSHFLEES